jgi:hypothetical protein
VNARPEAEGIPQSIAAGNSAGGIALAWDLMRPGVSHGAEAHGESREGIVPQPLSLGTSRQTIGGYPNSFPAAG